MSQGNQQIQQAQQVEQTQQVKEQELNNDGVQMVPVSEAIKYRKRAQAAEQQLELAAKQMAEQMQEFTELQNRVSEMKIETELTHKLVQAGAVDVEAATLLLRNKLQSQGDDKHSVDMNEMVAQLKRQRPYLFGGSNEPVAVWPVPTQGISSRVSAGVSGLKRLAAQVQQTGSRKDMQEYLRMRRAIIPNGNHNSRSRDT